MTAEALFAYWPDVSHLTWWELILMCIGAAYLVLGGLWPLLHSVLYALGYTGLHIRAILTRDKWRRYPATCLRRVLWTWPLKGLVEALDGTTQTTSINGVYWRPLFNYATTCNEDTPDED